jgi:hypothetical protein
LARLARATYVPVGAVGGARFGILRLGEGRVPSRTRTRNNTNPNDTEANAAGRRGVRVCSRDYIGRGKVPVAGERGVGVGRKLVGHRGAGRRRAVFRRAGRRRAGHRHGVGQQPPPLHIAGDGALRHEVRGEVVKFQLFIDRAAEIDFWAPNRPSVRHSAGE